MKDFYNSEIIIYQNNDGSMKIDVKLEDDTVWLSQQQMAELFQTSRTNVVEHIKNIYSEGELDENSTCRNFRQVRSEGTREVAKNYLEEDELKVLNNLVSGYFDFAEILAMRKRPMYMADYISQLDNILGSTGERLLAGAGKISHEKAMEKAITEYRKYQEKNLSDVEKSYVETIKKLNNKAKENKNI